MNNNIAICVNCYHNSDISKLILQLSTLLLKSKNIEDMINISNLKFNSLSESINYLLNHNFELHKTNNIHIAFYCDSMSGYQYSDLEDFKNRFDVSHFNELFKDRIIKFNELNRLYYFIYSKSPETFSEITNFELPDLLKIKSINYELYTKNEILRNKFNEKVKLLNNKYNLNITIKDKYTVLEFEKFNYIINFKIKINNINRHSFKYISDKLNINDKNINKSIGATSTKNNKNEYISDKLDDKNEYEFKNKSKEIFEKYFPNGFKMTYEDFLEIYTYQPELFNEDIENYFKSKFVNYNSNIVKVKNIYNEFHKIYNNSSFQGTKYHTNLMINRNQFLKDFDNYIKFFIDDDDLNCNIDNYNILVKLYNLKIYEIFNKSYEINKIKELIKDVSNLNILEFRKYFQNYFNQSNQFKRLIYVYYMKLCIYNVQAVIKNDENDKINKNKNINELNEKINKNYELRDNIISMWNKIIPEYLPFNYLNVQETYNEDSGFNYSHMTQFNVLFSKFPIYYYLSKSYNNYKINKNISNSELFNRINSININIDNSYQLYYNIGRYYYKYNSIIEFIKNSKSELRFVSNISNLDITKFNSSNFKEWNKKISILPLNVIFND